MTETFPNLRKKEKNSNRSSENDTFYEFPHFNNFICGFLTQNTSFSKS
jgi:hypothetical protein